MAVDVAVSSADAPARPRPIPLGRVAAVPAGWLLAGLVGLSFAVRWLLARRPHDPRLFPRRVHLFGDLPFAGRGRRHRDQRSCGELPRAPAADPERAVLALRRTRRCLPADARVERARDVPRGGAGLPDRAAAAAFGAALPGVRAARGRDAEPLLRLVRPRRADRIPARARRRLLRDAGDLAADALGAGRAGRLQRAGGVRARAVRRPPGGVRRRSCDRRRARPEAAAAHAPAVRAPAARGARARADAGARLLLADREPGHPSARDGGLGRDRPDAPRVLERLGARARRGRRPRLRALAAPQPRREGVRRARRAARRRAARRGDALRGQRRRGRRRRPLPGALPDDDPAARARRRSACG